MCGLFGFISSNDKENFEIDKFVLLGVANDSRGKDSCGVVLDTEYAYGIDKEKLFADFTIQNNFIANHANQHIDIAIGHCRKASVGAIKLETAQPVIITDDNNKVQFVFTHNGTLINHKELEKKYLGETPEHFTDSQILAWIIYYHGPQVLEEYEGAGAFVWTDYRGKTPKTFFFKGASKYNKWSTTISEERPLYITQTDKGLWWSSIKESLKIITFGQSEVIDLKCNTLFSITKNNLITETTIDRSSKFQTKSNYSYSYNSTIWESSEEDHYTPQYGSTYIVTNKFAVPKNVVKNKVFFDQGLYWLLGDKFKPEPITGIYQIWDSGHLPTVSNNAASVYYFYKGHLLDSWYNYEIALRLEQTLSEKEEFKDIWLAPLCYKQLYYHKNLNKVYQYIAGHLNNFNGKFPVFFEYGKVEYDIKNGKIKGMLKDNHYYYQKLYTPSTDMDVYLAISKDYTLEDRNTILDSEIEQLKQLV